jgi:hypothetical protein
MTVNPVLTASVSIAASANPVCSGTSVTFTATPANGGITPVFQWKVNGANVGTNGPVYSYTPANGDSIRCVVISSEACAPNVASSNTITMWVSTSIPCVLVPSVTTAAVSSIAQTSAISGGNITSDGGGEITARGVCWSNSPNPTIADNKTIDGSGVGTFSSNLATLTPNTTYYVKAYATNSVGTAYGNEINFSTLAFAIGQNYGGGIIFYIDGTGNHGLISSPFNQSISATWGCSGTTIGGTSTTIGAGQSNTTAIVNGCSTAGIAARICNDLSLNGYDDWFLPSKDALNQMYVNRVLIGGFTSNWYWSSSEYNSTSAWNQNFGNGNQGNWSSYKYQTGYVRAVRAF